MKNEPFESLRAYGFDGFDGSTKGLDSLPHATVRVARPNVLTTSELTAGSLHALTARQ